MLSDCPCRDPPISYDHTRAKVFELLKKCVHDCRNSTLSRRGKKVGFLAEAFAEQTRIYIVNPTEVHDCDLAAEMKLLSKYIFSHGA
jgi:hypothetical protein